MRGSSRAWALRYRYDGHRDRIGGSDHPLISLAETRGTARNAPKLAGFDGVAEFGAHCCALTGNRLETIATR